MSMQPGAAGEAVRLALAQLPSVERLLAAPACQPLLAEHGRTQALAAVRTVLDQWRSQLRGGTATSVPDDSTLIAQADAAARQRVQPQLRAVFNLTGTVLHTNLGRALLPEQAVQAVLAALTHPVNLEFNLDTGARGDRDDLGQPGAVRVDRCPGGHRRQQ